LDSLLADDPLKRTAPGSPVTSALHATVQVTALTDVGMRRANNQDNYAIVLAADHDHWQRIGDLLIVADGMGAHAAGELASQLAVELIPHHFSKLTSKHELPDALARSFEETNREIHRKGMVNPEFRSMGTTTCALAILPIGAVICHVGDSRVYRLRDQSFEQLTFDHSLVWEMQQSGEISEESIRNSVIPKNVITRSLGPSPTVMIDVEGPFAVRKGDRFLLCSDGLSGQLADEEIGNLLSLLDIHAAAKAMVDLANCRGGPDNITVVIAEAQRDIGMDSQSASTATRNSVSFPTLFGLLAATGFLTALFLAFIQQIPLALVFAAAALIALITGWIKMSTEKPAETIGKGTGKAPYRKYSLKPSIAFANELHHAVRELTEWLKANGSSRKLPTLETNISAAKRLIDGKNSKDAIKQLANLLVEVTQEIRDRRKEEDEGQVDY
jgi:PPM family protein phosphatase